METKLSVKDWPAILLIYISISIMQFAYFIATDWTKEAIEDIFMINQK